MVDAARKRATYADVVAAPSHKVAEIIDGDLVLSARPAPRHARAASVLGGMLFGPFDRGIGGPGGWWILDEPEIHPRGVHEPIVPDLGGWRVERLPDLPETAYFEMAPDWVCEVLSPSTAAMDRADKMPIYASIGVKHAWLVDPLLQTLEVFRQESGRRLLLAAHKGNCVVRAEPFQSVEIDLTPAWSRSRK
jgi:Uma2 family endonuclease